MPSDFSPDRLFTPHQASRLLPDIKIKLKEIMERKRVADALRNDVEHYSLVGFDTRGFSEKNQELDLVVKDLMAKVEELEDLGVKVRDIDMGLIDFPSLLDGEEIYLCWKLGEEHVAFWHRPDEGFAGRKPLDEPGSEPAPPQGPRLQ